LRRTAPGLDKLLRVGAVAIGMASIATLSGCGSSDRSTAQTASPTCQLVAAVLSDGPDPGDDLVGYAEAQIRPLRQIHTADRTLQQAIDRLDAAYQTFFDDGGASAALASVSHAANSLDTLCPGAGAGT
jgi:hypothetical protein